MATESCQKEMLDDLARRCGVLLWGRAAYVLLVILGRFELRNVAEAAIAGVGFGLMSLNFPRSLAKLQAGAPLSPASPPQG
jgi:hypothetical protein